MTRIRNEPDLDFSGGRILPEGVSVDLTQPNEHEVLERARAKHAAYAEASGDWDSYYASWDTRKSRSVVPDLERKRGGRGR